MANLFKKPSKKTAITAGITAAILAIIAVSGTAVYLKSRTQTEAADLDNQASSTSQTADSGTSSQNEGQRTDTQPENDGTTQDAGTTNEGTATDGTTDTTATTTGTPGTGTTGTTGTATRTTTGNTGRTATTADNIQDATITRTETTEIPERQIAEGHFVGWTPMDVNAELASANIKATPDDIITTKTGDKNVKQGEKVTYVITVENKSDRDLKSIEVRDPLNSDILDLSTINFLDNTQKAETIGNTLVWNIDIDAKATVTLKFEVTVKTNVAAGTKLVNTVITNGKEITDKPETEVEEATKKITVEKTWVGDEKVSDTVRPSNLTVNLNDGTKVEMTSSDKKSDNVWSKDVEVDKYDDAGNEITYNYASETSTDVNKFASYTATVGDATADTIKVTNTYKAPEVTDRTFNKDGKDVITSKDEKVNYTITYGATVKDYKGKATVTIVDTLPYEIDLDNSNIANGTYSKENKTITWVEEYDVDTFTNGAKEISITKNIEVVYKDMNVTAGTFVNKADATLKLDTNKEEIPEEPEEKPTTQNFKKDIKVVKVWQGDSEVASKVRPSDVTINLNEGKSIKLNSTNSNTWEDTIKDVDKYDKDGNEIIYNYVSETSTDANKLASYTATPSKDGDTITVTNAYAGAPEVTENNINKDGTEKITSKDDEVEYTINYTTKVDKYKGKATITIVDELPYAIDVSKSNIKVEGFNENYDANAKTITYTKQVDIDTFTNGVYTVNEELKIKVVYEGIDTTKTSLTNKSTGKIKLEETGDETPTDPDNHETETNFKKDIKVVKVWQGDSEVADKVRPSDVTINLNEGKSIKLNSTDSNTWEDTIKDVDKYDKDGNEIIYNYVSETSTDANKLASYTATPSKDGDTITVTNAYAGAPEVTENNINKDGTEKITSKDDEVEYTINYTTKVDKYKGKATITIVDELPYAINEEKSDINVEGFNAKYDANAKTITYTKQVDIDTFKDGAYTENDELNIKVVYVGIDTAKTAFTNKATGKIKLEETGDEKPTDPARKDTETEFKKLLTVKKVWQRDTASVRPSNITIKITDNKEATLTPGQDNSNTWETQIAVDKYDANGNDKVYEFVSESSTETEKLSNYLEADREVDNNSTKDTIVVTNKYRTISVSGTKTWDDVDNIKATRPTSINLKLMKSVNGEEPTDTGITKTVNAPENTADVQNTWNYTFDNLPEYENGNKITYSVVEQNVETGYTATPDGMNVTNKYPVERIETEKTSEVVSCAEDKTEHAKTANTNNQNAQYKVVAHEGDEIKYTITVKNTGNTTATVDINDQIKTGLKYDGGEITATLSGAETDKTAPATSGLINGNVLTLSNYQIDEGVTLTLTFVVKVEDLSEEETSKVIDKNIATITNDGNTNTPSDETEYEVKKANITATKTVDLDKAEKGDTLHYTITATNNSDEEGKLVIKDDLTTLINENKIENVRNVQLNGVAKPEIYANNIINYTDDHFAGHATATITFDVTVKTATVTDEIINVAKVNKKDYTAKTTVIKKVYSTAKPNEPINLILVLDVSGSMTADGSTRLQDMKTAANSMIDKLFPEGETTDSTVSIIKFDTDVNLILTANKQANKNTIKNTINNLKTREGTDGAGTNINGALQATNNLLSSGTLNNNKKVVVFLSDGAPTPAYYIQNGGRYDGYKIDNNDFTNNTEANINAKANELKGKANVSVYTIGLGVNSLSTERSSSSIYTECPNQGLANVTATKSYTIKRDGEEISGNTASSGDEIYYTITLTNNSDKDATVNVTDTKSNDVTISNNISNSGRPYGNGIYWSNISIEKNKSITLTYKATVDYDYGWGWSQSSKTINLTTEGVSLDVQKTGCGEANCIKANDGNYYHWEGEQSVAKRILKNIASDTSKYKESDDGVTNLTNVFDEIFNDMTGKTTTHTVETALDSTITIPETRTLAGDTIKLKIGDAAPISYKISEISTESGKDGIKYTPGVGFTWTIKKANENDRLELIYTYQKAQ